MLTIDFETNLLDLPCVKLEEKNKLPNTPGIYFCLTEDIFVKAVMGHTEETTQSAQSYLDYELDNSEVEKLLNYYG